MASQGTSVETITRLKERARACELYKPFEEGCYEPGMELTYRVQGFAPNSFADVSLEVEKFVGGGFAGQVYKVRVTDVQAEGEVDLQVDGSYAMKILIPPSGFSKLFRNTVYWMGFQGPFQLQVNPAAARAGALWQKFIRKAAAVTFEREDAVVDIHATFVDERLGSCGELSEWIEGRSWRLEVDDHMDLLRKWSWGQPVPEEKLGSPEYRAKKKFMADFVAMLHEMGAPEFARQYEWSTCKSQPNCLKRLDSGDDPAEGLVAVDFRAGLALLPYLPMSPGDFKLIGMGLKRGSLVQFDRGDLQKLEGYVNEHLDAGSRTMLAELKQNEEVYRNSLPDITHNFPRIFYSGKLWGTILSSAITGWKVKQLVDEESEKTFRASNFKTLVFLFVGFIPFLGRFIRKIWARPDWRKHYASLVSSGEYFKRALNAKMIQAAIKWHRDGRISEKQAEKVSSSLGLFILHSIVRILPAGLHRFVTDGEYAIGVLYYLTVRPVKLYFNSELREQWLRDMVSEGQRKHMLSDEDADTILSHLKEPYIQKYLKSLAVHVCTLPVTQVVSVAVALWYKYSHGLSWGEAWEEMLIILAAFQVVPISPGSICRGMYVLYLVIRERNFKDYNIAVFLGFFKYVGYLAFPIQMTYRYPAMARFMAGHWATEAVHIVPVFGERGALLEHWVFCLFYNWPLTIRRRMGNRAAVRKNMPSRIWHVPLLAIGAAGLFAWVERVFASNHEALPSLRELWYMVLLVPIALGACVTLGAGGMKVWKRIVSGWSGAIIMALLTIAATMAISNNLGVCFEKPIAATIWRIFLFSIFTVIGVLVTELLLPDVKEPQI